MISIPMWELFGIPPRDTTVVVVVVVVVVVDKSREWNRSNFPSEVDSKEESISASKVLPSWYKFQRLMTVSLFD